MDSLPRIRKHDDRDGGRQEGGREGGRQGGGREYYSRDDRRDRDRGDHRRRSRSPHHRTSRHEQDSYSSSRDYRAQEREDRYAAGRREPRREEREWDRDRGPRRERDDRRGGREDDRFGGGGGRDAFERRDRRGGAAGGRGGREDRGDRDEFAAQRNARVRSRSPQQKKKEPTPDLTDVVGVLQRKRRLTQWDIKPPGYENVTAEQAKLSGMFPLPGAPRQQAIDPSKLQSLINQPGAAETGALKPSNARQSKRLFVQNIPGSATEESVISFFNLHLNGLNVIESVDPCISCQIAKDSSFALIEFKNPPEATVALALDGTSMEAADSAANGSAAGGLAIRRPKDYIVPDAGEESATADTPMDGVVSTTVPDSANKLSITHLLPGLDDEQVKELISTFGALKSFVLVKDKSTDESRGIAFCEYADPTATAMAVEGLNGMEVGGTSLKVQRASVGSSQAGMEMSVNAMSMLAGTTSVDLQEGRVLQLLNMVTAEELIDDEDYAEIVEDVKEECGKYGLVEEIKVPRPALGSRQSAGVGKIFIKYDGPESARKALQSLAGRKFADRTVISTYFSEESFEVNAW